MPDQATRPRVLVADDDSAMRMLLAEILRADGLEVAEAADGRELLRSIERATRSGESLDLVISDVRMPVQNGLAVLEDVVDDPRGAPALRVILMTAFPDPDIKRRAASHHFLLLEKPFDLGALLGAVHDLLPAQGNGAGRSSTP